MMLRYIIFLTYPPSQEKGKFLPRRIMAKNYLGCVETCVLPVDKPPTHITGYSHCMVSDLFGGNANLIRGNFKPEAN